jgi:hypothetical protein
MFKIIVIQSKDSQFRLWNLPLPFYEFYSLAATGFLSFISS